jgi:uncharacterized protein (DUF433 family)
VKLTKQLRSVIIRQFKSGDTIEYLAKLYGFTNERVEQAIREALIERDTELEKQVADAMGQG